MMMIIVQSGRVTSDEEEADYDYTSKWEYLGKGIWENQVRAVLSVPYIFFGVWCTHINIFNLDHAICHWSCFGDRAARPR